MNTNPKTVRIPRALALQAAEQRRADREAVERHLVSVSASSVETSFSAEVRAAARLRRVGVRHLVGVRYDG